MNEKRNTRQKKMIYDTVIGRHDHPSAEDVYEEVNQKDSRISRSTVYRNLEILAEEGRINLVKVPRMNHYDLRLDNHYHIVCNKCGKVSDAPFPYNDQYDRNVEKEFGFMIDRHRLVFEGVCPICINQEREKK